jgi:AcrR family transcriptional regulator
MLATDPQEERLDPRVKRTRGLIRKAFLELLAEKGFQSITVQDIAGRAEVNRATFYAHFPDKYALLEASIRQSFRQELEKRTLSACHYSADNLRALIVTVCEFVAQSHERCKTSDSQFESLVEAQVRKQVQELLELWLEKTGSEIDPKMAAIAASWAIDGLALQWNREKDRPPVEAYAGQIMPLIAANLRLKRETVPA